MTLHINTVKAGIVTVSLKKKGEVVNDIADKNEHGSQLLLVLISNLLKINGLKFSDLQEVEVEEGPGSFTGLRVGAAVALGLGFALNIPVNGEINKPVSLKYT